MQVGVDVTYVHTNFSSHDLSSFGDIAMDYCPWSSKNLIN